MKELTGNNVRVVYAGMDGNLEVECKKQDMGYGVLGGSEPHIPKSNIITLRK